MEGRDGLLQPVEELGFICLINGLDLRRLSHGLRL